MLESAKFNMQPKFFICSFIFNMQPKFFICSFIFNMQPKFFICSFILDIMVFLPPKHWISECWTNVEPMLSQCWRNVEPILSQFEPYSCYHGFPITTVWGGKRFRYREVRFGHIIASVWRNIIKWKTHFHISTFPFLTSDRAIWEETFPHFHIFTFSPKFFICKEIEKFYIQHDKEIEKFYIQHEARYCHERDRRSFIKPSGFSLFIFLGEKLEISFFPWIFYFEEDVIWRW